MKKVSDKLECDYCHKKYSEERSLAVHLKTKHRNDQKSQKYESLKLKFSSETFLKAEEEIYLFLSQLSHKHAYSLETLVKLKLYDPVCHSAGKNHFVINPIIKNPFESQDPEEEMKEKINSIIQFNKVKQNHQKTDLINDIQTLNSVLDQQSTNWYFADPYDESIDFNDEFTLDNIPKLVKNIIKKKMSLQNIPVSVFFLWLGRLLKNQPFLDLWKIISLVLDYSVQSISVKQDQEKVGGRREKKMRRDLNEGFLEKNFQDLELMFSMEEYKKWIELYCNWEQKISELMAIQNSKN